MLSKILLPREAGAGAALAVIERAEERLLGAAVHLVHLALVTKKTATVGKTLELLAALYIALVRPVVLVHVLAPFALAIEDLSSALSVAAVHLAL